MSAPIIWILIPGILALLLYFFRRWYRITVMVATFVTSLLAALAHWMLIDQVNHFGPWSWQVASTLSVFGRRLELVNADRPVLTVIYLMAAFWFGAAYVAQAGRLFAALGLAAIAVLTAAFAVEPFLYAALLIELAALICVPLLVSPGKSVGQGSLRFLVFQTLGMPFILFTGWMLAGVEASPGDMAMVYRAAGLLGFGFAFLLAIFPFHTWYPLVAEEAHPYPAVFVFLVFPWMISLFGLSFIDRYAWLRNSEGLYDVLRLAGTITVFTAGIWSAFERHLGRILAYAALTETGFALLAVSIPGGIPLFFGMMLPRTIALAIWALALSALYKAYPGLLYREIKGAGRSMPVVALGLVVAHLSVAGIPLLAGFPLRFILWNNLAQISLGNAAFTLLGVIGLFASGLRTLTVMVTGPDDSNWRLSEPWQYIFFIGVGILALLAVGVMPQWTLSAMEELAASFKQLIP